MRVILDTNVLMSGLFWSGPPFNILQAWQTGQVKLVACQDILKEYLRVSAILNKKYPNIEINPILDLIIENLQLYQSVKLSTTLCRDPDDDKFIACALSSAVNTIISGDSDLLDVSGFLGINVYKPKEFIEEYLNLEVL